MNKWNKLGRALRLWLAVAASGASLAYYLVGLAGKWSS